MCPAPAPQSLEDLIKGGDSGKAPGARSGGRSGGGRAPGRGAAPTRNSRSNQRSTPYARPKKDVSGDDHMGNAHVSDVAASANPVLKVKGDSVAKSVAGAICNVVRESARNEPPAVVATGPAAINQAMKAIAIARKYLLDEETPSDLVCIPRFEEEIRHGSRCTFVLKKMRPIRSVPSEDDLSSKEKTDPYKLGGAIAGRLRDGEQVACTTKGPVPVLIAVKAIAIANTYVADEGMEIKFCVGIVDLENPEIKSDSVTSTYLHFHIISK
jgi:stage V sporulation protein SpoVS